jgi:hypothetical protein
MGEIMNAFRYAVARYYAKHPEVFQLRADIQRYQELEALPQQGELFPLEESDNLGAAAAVRRIRGASRRRFDGAHTAMVSVEQRMKQTALRTQAEREREEANRISKLEGLSESQRVWTAERIAMGTQA